MKKRKINIKKYLPVFILFSILAFSIGYAAINSINMNISGNVQAKSVKEIQITNIEVVSMKAVSVENCNVTAMANSSINSTITLSSTDPSSSITYRVTIYNPTSIDYVFKRAIYGEDWYDNENILFILRNIDTTTKLKKTSSISFEITFFYKDTTLQENNILNSIINFEFEPAYIYLKEKIKSEVSTRKDLYYDNTNDNNIRFRGNANNYIMFNNQLWRIIGIMNNIEDKSGSKSDRIKIIYSNYDFESVWDINKPYEEINIWENSSLYKTLSSINGAYWKNSLGLCPNNEQCDMTGRGLTEESKKYIVQATWNTSGIKDYKNVLSKDLYVDERTIKNESGYHQTVSANVGLMYPSDYAYASASNKCLDIKIGDWDSECYDSNWLVKGNLNDSSYERPWTISHYLDSVTDVVSIGGEALCNGETDKSAYCTHYVRPVVYLVDDVIIKSGEGTEQDPWIIEIKNENDGFDWKTLKHTWIGDMMLSNSEGAFSDSINIEGAYHAENYTEEYATLESMNLKVQEMTEFESDIYIIDGGVVDIFGNIMNYTDTKEVGTVNMYSTTPSYNDTIISNLEEIIYTIKTKNPKAKILYLNMFNNTESGFIDSFYDYYKSKYTLEEINNYFNTSFKTYNQAKNHVLNYYGDENGNRTYLNDKYDKLKLFYTELEKVISKYNLDYLDLKKDLSSDYLYKGLYPNSAAFDESSIFTRNIKKEIEKLLGA